MKHAPSTSVNITVLLAAAILVGCRSVNDQDNGSETAPERTTALAPKFRKLPNSGPVSFADQVKPIFESKCLPCHSGSYAMGGFSLDSSTHAFAKGAKGARIVPGQPEASPLLALSSAHHGMDVMPKVGNRVTKFESLILRQWILEGASWPSGASGVLKPREDWINND